MNQFEYSYDEENDDLFMYLPNKKSIGAVELGDFIFDFDKEENLVSMEILNASKILSKLLSKVISLTAIKGYKMQVINFRNMEAIHLEVDLGAKKETVNIFIPRIKEHSPVLNY